MIVKENSKIITLLNLVEFQEELKQVLNKKVNVVIEETYTKELMNENKYGKLAKELFYEQVQKDRGVLYDQFRFAHHYGDMNLEIIFDTALNDIPKLNKFIQKELENIDI